MSYDQWVALAVVIYLGFTVLVTAHVWREKRAERRLTWAASTTQRQMERYVIRFLTRRRWQVTLFASHAGKSVYGSARHDETMFVLMLREISFFSRLIRSLRGDNPLMLQRLAIVLFETPTAPMVAAAAEVGITLMHYTDLPAIVERLQRVLPNNMTAEGRAPAIPPSGVMTASLTRTG